MNGTSQGDKCSYDSPSGRSVSLGVSASGSALLLVFGILFHEATLDDSWRSPWPVTQQGTAMSMLLCVQESR